MLSSIFWQDLRSEQTHERGNITHVWLCSNDPNRERAKGRHYKKEINIEGKNKGKTINNTVMNHLIYSFFFKLCRCGNIHIIIATIKSECFFWYRKLTFLLSYNILLFFFFFQQFLLHQVKSYGTVTLLTYIECSLLGIRLLAVPILPVFAFCSWILLITENQVNIGLQ